jgi:hypothetical protein
MIPSPSEILRRRVTAATVLRIAAVGVGMLTLFPLGIWLAEGIADGDLLHLRYYTPNFVGAGVIATSSAALWALAPLAARLAIPVPRVHTCPGCRYRLQGLHAPQCPECGLPLTPEFMTTPADPAHRHRRADLVFLRQIAALAIRLASLLAALPVSIYLFNMLMNLISRPDFRNAAFTVPPLIASGLVLLGYLLAPRLALRVVLTRAGFERPVLWSVLAAASAVGGLCLLAVSLWDLAEGKPSAGEYAFAAAGVGLIVSAFPVAGLGGAGRSRPLPPPAA